MNTLVDEIMLHVSQGYCCSQVLMLLQMRKFGHENPELIRAMHGLCYGIGGSEGPCGLLSGGACVFGYLIGRGKDQESAHPSFVPLAADYQQWFAVRTERYGGTACFQIMEGLSAETGIPRPGAGEQPSPCLCGSLFIECWEKIHALLEEYQIPMTHYTRSNPCRSPQTDKHPGETV
ncbi:MAG: C-GCAxxG-C-C family protein [Candidatus Adiutrix sp.]|nr:C-GCAxxG-C-C family protein [Candidatus Adiutrix sp.]